MEKLQKVLDLFHIFNLKTLFSKTNNGMNEIQDKVNNNYETSAEYAQ